jgi:hypothetical protein
MHRPFSPLPAPLFLELLARAGLAGQSRDGAGSLVWICALHGSKNSL